MLLFLIILGVITLGFRDLLNAAISLACFSLLLSLVFYFLHAPDVAIAEAAVGAGLATVLFVLVISKTERVER